MRAAEVGDERIPETDENGIGAGPGFEYRRRAVEDAFGEKEAQGQFDILAGGAHGHGNVLFDAGGRGSVLQSYLQRLFDGYGIGGLDDLAREYLTNRQAGDPGGWNGTGHIQIYIKLGDDYPVLKRTLLPAPVLPAFAVHFRNRYPFFCRRAGNFQ